MKSQLLTAALTKITRKKINDMTPTWHQIGQFKPKFQKVVRCYNFFFKWIILTQNSTAEDAHKFAWETSQPMN